MKVSVENLGPIRKAEFEIGDLTIICGPGNTGKTYVTHATYGFLEFIRSGAWVPVDSGDIDQLYKSGSVTIALGPYRKNLQRHVSAAARRYSKVLPMIFAGSDSQFEGAKFALKVNGGQQAAQKSLFKLDSPDLGYVEQTLLQTEYKAGQDAGGVTLAVDKAPGEVPLMEMAADVISNKLRKALLGKYIPRPFIISAERTGAAIFQRELDFTKSKILEIAKDRNTKLSLDLILDKFGGEYPIAVRRNVDFIRSLPDMVKKESYIHKKRPDILDMLRVMAGGEYTVSEDGAVYFIPANNKRKRLSLAESSGAVRSLLNISFYLRHHAQPGDMLIVDEPELNLHPENQCKLARLFVRLVNLGIKVFITTHSDYIIKELNTLIMLNQDDKRIRALAKREKYQDDELLDHAKVRAYTAMEKLTALKGAKQKAKSLTLTPMPIDDDLGMEEESFDLVIGEMSRIQEEIYWGDDW